MINGKMHCNNFCQYLPLIGRVLLGLIFVLSGFGKLSDPAGTAGYMTAYGLPYANVLVWPTGLIEFGGGLLLMLGWHARWAAAALILFVIAATLVFHQFWNVDAAQMQMQQINFLKNLAIIGGLLYVVAYGSGACSLSKGCKPAEPSA
jgi:putative oxidoreductase